MNVAYHRVCGLTHLCCSAVVTVIIIIIIIKYERHDNIIV